jgi:uncharacterized membrane protein
MIQYSNFIALEMLILIILFVIIIVTVIAVAIKRKSPSQVQEEPQITEEFEENVSTITKEQDARSMKILKERLAKGEITKEEYDELKKEFEK